MGATEYIPYRPPHFDVDSLNPAFRHSLYRFRRRVLTILGARVDVFDQYRQRVLHCHQRAFRLREDIRLYSDDRHTQELIAINARQIIDFSASYDVVDATDGNYIGTLRRKGWTSLIRDVWEIVDLSGNVMARLQEDSAGLALVRRFLTNLIPQKFYIDTASGERAAELRQHFNPFVYWLDLHIHGPAHAPLIAPRLLIAAATLIATIERRQDRY